MATDGMIQNAMQAMTCILQAYATIEGMKAENMKRQMAGESLAYREEDFQEALHLNGADWNSIITTMNRGM
jgi:hypothetical protein